MKGRDYLDYDIALYEPLFFKILYIISSYLLSYLGLILRELFLYLTFRLWNSLIVDLAYYDFTLVNTFFILSFSVFIFTYASFLETVASAFGDISIGVLLSKTDLL